jgi:hypothetical protein
MPIKFNELLGIRMDSKLHSFLDETAEKKGLKTSSLVRSILKNFMEDSLDERN